MTRTMPKRVAAAVAAAAASLALGLGTAGVADAKIHEEPISCSNPAGHEPGGQQPSCQNDNLTQESEFQNPAGKAPGGWNK